MSYPIEFRFLPDYKPTITQQWEYSNADGLWHGIGNCVGHAFACLMSYLYKASTTIDMQFSYQWVYGNRSASDAQNEGMWVHEALPHLQAQGVPPYVNMPRQNTYDLVTVDTYPSATDTSTSLMDVPLAKNDVINNYSGVIGTAIQYRINGWGEVNFSDINAIKSRVMKAPVILDLDSADFDLSYIFGCSSLETAIIRMNMGIPGLNYHALLIIGWKVINGTPYWIVRNNWGWYWGYNAEALLPMNYNLVRKAYYVTYAFNPISTFAWDYVRVSGMKYKDNKIKATEWNRLQKIIIELYSRFNGTSIYMNDVSTGNIFTATRFNSVVNYINNLARKNGMTTMSIPSVSSGSKIYADYFNQISGKVNELVTFANN